MVRVTLNWKIKFQCLQILEERAYNDSDAMLYDVGVELDAAVAAETGAAHPNGSDRCGPRPRSSPCPEAGGLVFALSDVSTPRRFSVLIARIVFSNA